MAVDAAQGFEAYLKDVPLLHSWDDGATWNNGGFGDYHLRALAELVRLSGANARVIETGAGNSTITFLLAGAAEVISVAPDAELFGRIQAHCATHQIETAPLKPHVAYSERELPKIAQVFEAQDAWLDVALIDGGHGWPTVFVDFCYMNMMLRQGGFLAIDDVQLHSVKELARWLYRGAHFFELHAEHDKLRIFRKRSDARLIPDFGAQPYIIERVNADAQAGRSLDLF